MDNKYLQANDIIKKAMYDLRKLLDQADYEGAENSQAYDNLEYLIEKMEDTTESIEYLAAEVKEGVLFLDKKLNKFYIKYYDGTESYPLSCGSSLEYFYDEWLFGGVEYTQRDGKEGYYFYNHEAGHPFLMEGMIVRKRMI